MTAAPDEAVSVRYQRDFYDRHASRRADAVRQQVRHPLFAAFYDRLADEVLAASDRRPLRVYEAGCGEGLLAAALHRRAAAQGIELVYTGSDVSASSTGVARELAPGRYLAGDASRVTSELPEGSSDVVVAKNLLHHLEDPGAFLAAAARVVKPGGRVVLCEAKLGVSQSTVFNVLAFRRERHFFRGLGRNVNRPLAEAGLVPVTARPFNALPFELLFAIRYDWFRRLVTADSPRFLTGVATVDEAVARRAPWLATYHLVVAQPA